MSTITEYLEELSGRSVTLLRAGVKVTVRDKANREKVADLAQELESLGATLVLGPDYLKDLGGELIFRTPGLSPNTPELAQAVENGAALSSEMEVFFQTCPSHLVAVTGSDGKTTTTTIISEFLKEAGKTVYVGGNIGKPLLPDVADMDPEDFAVLELSSFQLMTMEQSPNIAVITNLAPNHLDYHHTMEEYTNAKKNIFLHQGEGDRLILNYDNEVTRSMAAEAVCPVTWFSRKERLEEGVYLRDNAIWLTNEMGSREVLPLSDIQLPGVHNIENYMAAIAAVDGLVPDKCVRAVARRFHGVEHRIEPVRTLNGVQWFNDSIATSPTRVIAGLRAFDQKLIIIAGGSDKGISFAPLAPELIAHVKTLILTGATAQKIEDAVKADPGFAESGLVILRAADMPQAVEMARAAAQPGDIVSLSPACASFDSYPNFEARGRHYKELVNAL